MCIQCIGPTLFRYKVGDADTFGCRATRNELYRLPEDDVASQKVEVSRLADNARLGNDCHFVTTPPPRCSTSMRINISPCSIASSMPRCVCGRSTENQRRGIVLLPTLW